MSNDRVYIRHARQCSGMGIVNCSRGIREYMKSIGFNHFIFLTEGIPFSYLEEHGGSIGKCAIEIAKKEYK